MIKKITLNLLFATTFGFILDLYYNDLQSFSSGPPAGRTGSPGDGANCTACHSGTPITQTGLITTNIPSTGYVPGTTYLVTATVTMPGVTKFGFQISPQNVAGTLLGTLSIINTTQTQLVGNGKYVEHTSSGTSGTGGTKTWTFNWTAPQSGTGNVTFYGAFNASNNNSSNTGDQIILTNTVVTEDPDPIVATLTSVDATCFGDCDGSISATISGGVPPYSVSWSNMQTGDSINNLCDGIYTATISDNSGRIMTVSDTVSEPAVLSTTNAISGTTCSTCSDGSVTVNVSGGVPPYTVNWDHGPVGTTLSNQSTGTYFYTVTDLNGCTYSDSAIISVGVSVNLHTPKPQIRLFPNPASEYFVFNGLEKAEQMVMMDITGKTVLERQVENNNKVIISGLPAGVYIVKVGDRTLNVFKN